MNTKNLNEFIDIFFTNELIFVILVILAMVLVVLLIYLVKAQRTEQIKFMNEKTKDIVIPSIKSEETEVKEELDAVDLFNSLMPSNDEENAIISADELIKASQNLSDTMQMDTSEIINMYEEEQEKKAIISYEELLKNAASLNIKYEEPHQKEETEPVIKKIEINNEDNFVKTEVQSTNKVLDYVEEEEFLKVLKKFRMDLET